MESHAVLVTAIRSFTFTVISVLGSVVAWHVVVAISTLPGVLAVLAAVLTGRRISKGLWKSSLLRHLTGGQLPEIKTNNLFSRLGVAMGLMVGLTSIWFVIVTYAYFEVGVAYFRAPAVLLLATSLVAAGFKFELNLDRLFVRHE